MTETAIYELFVDWNGDGDFSDAGEDCSDDWMSASISRGFNSAMARLPSTGRASFTLLNLDRQYSPPLDADVVPRREVQFDMTYGGSTVTLFRGYLESIAPTSGSYEERRVQLECVDALALLDLYEGEIALDVDVYADDIVADVINAVYTPPDTDYQAGINLFPISADVWAYEEPGKPVEEIKATGKLTDVCTADWGVFFIAKDGAPTFYNRHQMPLDATVELTLAGTMQALSYQMSVGSVFNYVEVTCYPRTVGATLEVLGRISQDKAPAIEANADLVLVVQFRDSGNQKIKLGGMSCVTPVATTDYEVTSDPEGQGDDVTASVNAAALMYGDHAEITLSNTTANVVYLQKLQVRGYGVRTREKITVVSQDATSIAAYQRRKLRVNAVLMSNPAEAQVLADFLLDRYKDPQGVVGGIGFVANVNATLMAAARDLELCDRATVSETQTGLSSYAGHVAALDHRITPVQHNVTFSLIPHYDIGTPFRLDISQLDSGDVLIY